MTVSTMNDVRALWRRHRLAVLAALSMAALAAGAWLGSATVARGAAEVIKVNVRTSDDDLKPKLIGSYEVTGTEPDGTPYVRSGIVDITLTPSGALELDWDNGRLVGVGQVIGNMLVVASYARGRMVILVMNVNPDGSLSGRSLRRTDRGSKGTEVWTRK